MLCFQSCLPSLYGLLYLVDVFISGVCNCHFVFHNWHEKVDIRFIFIKKRYSKRPLDVYQCHSNLQKLITCNWLKVPGEEGHWLNREWVKGCIGHRETLPLKVKMKDISCCSFFSLASHLVVMKCWVISQLQICDGLCPYHCRGHSSTQWSSHTRVGYFKWMSPLQLQSIRFTLPRFVSVQLFRVHDVYLAASGCALSSVAARLVGILNGVKQTQMVLCVRPRSVAEGMLYVLEGVTCWPHCAHE